MKNKPSLFKTDRSPKNETNKNKTKQEQNQRKIRRMKRIPEKSWTDNSVHDYRL